MITFGFRFRFNISSKGLMLGDEKSVQFNLPDGRIATFSCIDSETLSESTRFVISSGGYRSAEEAFAFGEQVKESVLCFGTKFRMGIDVGKDKATSFLGKVIKDEILKTHGVRIIDDVHGISVHNEEYPISCGSCSAAVLFNSRKADFFLDELCNIISATKAINAKNRLAMELLTSSYFESSPRSRFLTLILAAEALLEPENRSEEVKDFVDEFKKLTTASGLPSEEKTSIIGTLNWLYKDSISKSLKKMANTHLGGKQYDGLAASKFINKCYEARSKLVHTGSVDESRYHIGLLAANLEVYLMDMLTNIARL
jgi:hypothetical protein